MKTLLLGIAAVICTGCASMGADELRANRARCDAIGKQAVVAQYPDRAEFIQSADRFTDNDRLAPAEKIIWDGVVGECLHQTSIQVQQNQAAFAGALLGIAGVLLAPPPQTVIIVTPRHH